LVSGIFNPCRRDGGCGHQCAAAAGPVYTLLGKEDLGTTNFPPMGTGLMDGDIAFRQHNGGHTDALNWPVLLDFAARYFEPASASPVR